MSRTVLMMYENQGGARLVISALEGTGGELNDRKWGGSVHPDAQRSWLLVAAVLFTAPVVSVGAHSIYYSLIDRYEANLLAPLTLMTSFGTIALGVLRARAPELLGASAFPILRAEN